MWKHKSRVTALGGSGLLRGVLALGSLAAVACLAGCATHAHRAVAPDALPQPVEFSAIAKKAPIFAFGLALSGGGMRGYAHVGVLESLSKNDLRPDLIVGTSAGALVATLYSARNGEVRLVRDALMRLEASAMFSPVIPRIFRLPGELGMSRLDGIELFIEREIGPCRIERLPIAVAITATDLDSGEPIVLLEGDCARAIHASMAIPGITVPVTIRSRRLIDGQTTSPLPTEPARRLGAAIVVAVDVVYPPPHASMTDTMDVALQGWNSTVYALSREQARNADVVIRPKLPPKNQLTSEDRSEIIAAGLRAGDEAIQKIKTALQTNQALGFLPSEEKNAH